MAHVSLHQVLRRTVPFPTGLVSVLGGQMRLLQRAENELQFPISVYTSFTLTAKKPFLAQPCIPLLPFSIPLFHVNIRNTQLVTLYHIPQCVKLNRPPNSPFF